MQDCKQSHWTSFLSWKRTQYLNHYPAICRAWQHTHLDKDVYNKKIGSIVYPFLLDRLCLFLGANVQYSYKKCLPSNQYILCHFDHREILYSLKLGGMHPYNNEYRLEQCENQAFWFNHMIFQYMVSEYVQRMRSEAWWCCWWRQIFS